MKRRGCHHDVAIERESVETSKRVKELSGKVQEQDNKIGRSEAQSADRPSSLLVTTEPRSAAPPSHTGQVRRRVPLKHRLVARTSVIVRAGWP